MTNIPKLSIKDQNSLSDLDIDLEGKKLCFFVFFFFCFFLCFFQFERHCSDVNKD